MEDDAHRNLGIAVGGKQKYDFHFLSRLKISDSQKERKVVLRNKVNTAKSGKPKHTLFMNLKYKIPTIVCSRWDAVFSLWHVKSKKNCETASGLST